MSDDCPIFGLHGRCGICHHGEYVMEPVFVQVAPTLLLIMCVFFLQISVPRWEQHEPVSVLCTVASIAQSWCGET